MMMINPFHAIGLSFSLPLSLSTSLSLPLSLFLSFFLLNTWFLFSRCIEKDQQYEMGQPVIACCFLQPRVCA